MICLHVDRNKQHVVNRTTSSDAFREFIVATPPPARRIEKPHDDDNDGEDNDDDDSERVPSRTVAAAAGTPKSLATTMTPRRSMCNDFWFSMLRSPIAKLELHVGEKRSVAQCDDDGDVSGVDNVNDNAPVEQQQQEPKALLIELSEFGDGSSRTPRRAAAPSDVTSPKFKVMSPPLAGLASTSYITSPTSVAVGASPLGKSSRIAHRGFRSIYVQLIVLFIQP
jgi:hypothetical protein